MFLTAPFLMPADFLKQFGYPGSRRFVGIYWEPCGDESAFSDGEMSASGMTDNWLYLKFVREPHVRQWIDEHGLHLGNSEDEAKDWLIVDSETGALHAANCSEARQIVTQQAIPG